MDNYTFDWSELAFGSKKAVVSLKATFIAAPRDISPARLTQLIKEHLPKGHIILGIAKEDYIDGFDGQPQFRTLKVATVQSIIDKVNRSASAHKLYTLAYFQRELPHIIEKLKPVSAIFINGSWHHSFHTLPVYFALINHQVPYQLVSPFCDEQEARQYERLVVKEIAVPSPSSNNDSDTQMMSLASQVAKASFDYGFQTGVVLAKKTSKGYKYLESGFNRVLPYQTHAMHEGASREKNFSPPNDLNHYDTIHAEMELLVKTQKERIDLKDTTLFINLMPCPSCARTLSTTDIGEYVYQTDHSNGYAVSLLEKCGKTVRRIV